MGLWASLSTEDMRSRAAFLDAVDNWPDRFGWLGLFRATDIPLLFRADRDVVLALARAGCSMRAVPDGFKADREIVLACMQEHGGTTYDIPHAFKEDYDMLLACFRSGGGWPSDVPAAFKEDRAMCLAMMESGAGSSHDIPAVFKDDYEICLAAMQGGGGPVPEAFKDSKELILASLEHDGDMYSIPAQHRNDRDMCLAVLRRQGTFYDVPAAHKDDREMALAVAENKNDRVVAQLQECADEEHDRIMTCTIHCIPEQFKNDRSIALALAKRGVSLAQAAASLQADRAFVLAAMQGDGASLAGAKDVFKADREIALAAVKGSPGRIFTGLSHCFYRYEPDNWWHVAPVLKADPVFMLDAVSANEVAFKKAAPELQKEPGFVLAAAQRNGKILPFVSNAFRSSKDVVLAALTQAGNPSKPNSRPYSSTGAPAALVSFAARGLQADEDVRALVAAVEDKVRIRAIRAIVRGGSGGPSAALALVNATPALRLKFWHPLVHAWCTSPQQHACVVAVLFAEMRIDRQPVAANVPSLPHDVWLLLMQFLQHTEIGSRGWSVSSWP